MRHKWCYMLIIYIAFDVSKLPIVSPESLFLALGQNSLPKIYLNVTCSIL